MRIGPASFVPSSQKIGAGEKLSSSQIIDAARLVELQQDGEVTEASGDLSFTS